MGEHIDVEDLRRARQALRQHFMRTDLRLVRLLDEPFLTYEWCDKMGRLLEFRTEVRGVIVNARPDMFDAFFHNVGPDDEVRMLTIGTPLQVGDYSDNISAACFAWIIESQSEQAVLKMLG